MLNLQEKSDQCFGKCKRSLSKLPRKEQAQVISNLMAIWACAMETGFEALLIGARELAEIHNQVPEQYRFLVDLPCKEDDEENPRPRFRIVGKEE
jgi:hypothetical protein